MILISRYNLIYDDIIFVKIVLMLCTFSQEPFIVGGLKFLQAIYGSFDYDLTQGFFIHDFNK